MPNNLILASSSSSRKMLLERAGIKSFCVIAADIEEMLLPREKPVEMSKRLAEEKALKVSNEISDGIILSADTVVTCGNTFLDKAMNDEDVRSHLRRMSGKRIAIITSIFVIKKENGITLKSHKKTVKSIVKMRNLNKSDIEYYVETKDGIGKSGGFALEGRAPHFIEWIRGSYSGILGLPMYETINLLKSCSYDIDS